MGLPLRAKRVQFSQGASNLRAPGARGSRQIVGAFAGRGVPSSGTPALCGPSCGTAVMRSLTRAGARCLISSSSARPTGGCVPRRFAPLGHAQT